MNNPAKEHANGPIYSIDGLSFSAGGRKILDGVDLSVRPGEFVVVIGPNGAGKSTLLKHLVRVIKPSPGTVRLSGRCVMTYRQREIAAMVGYVPQSAPVYLPFTALQFVLMGRYPHTNPLVRPDSTQTGVAMSMLDCVGMADFADRRLDAMSGGERQKIFIAAAIAQQPQILLLDEPTTFLDPRHQCEIQNIIESLNRKNRMAVLAVSHDINFAVRFAGRIAAMKRGRVIFDGSPGEIMSPGRLEQIYDTPFEYAGENETGKIFAFPVRHDGDGKK